MLDGLDPFFWACANVVGFSLCCPPETAHQGAALYSTNGPRPAPNSVASDVVRGFLNATIGDPGLPRPNCFCEVDYVISPVSPVGEFPRPNSAAAAQTIPLKTVRATSPSPCRGNMSEKPGRLD